MASLPSLVVIAVVRPIVRGTIAANLRWIITLSWSARRGPAACACDVRVCGTRSAPRARPSGMDRAPSRPARLRRCLHADYGGRASARGRRLGEKDDQAHPCMTAPAGTPPPQSPRSPLTRALALVAEVEPRETFSVLLLTLDSFLLLASYHFLKVIREPLILAVPGGGCRKSYATAALAVLLIGVFYAYRAVAKRVGRMRLITLTKLFCVGCLLVFSLLGRLGVPLGIPFISGSAVTASRSSPSSGPSPTMSTPLAQGKRLFADRRPGQLHRRRRRGRRLPACWSSPSASTT